jgi:hypothetical protein
MLKRRKRQGKQKPEKEAKRSFPINTLGKVSNHHEQQNIFFEISVQIFCTGTVVYLIKL